MNVSRIIRSLSLGLFAGSIAVAVLHSTGPGSAATDFVAPREVLLDSMNAALNDPAAIAIPSPPVKTSEQLLDTRVTIDFENVPLEAALNRWATLSNVRLISTWTAANTDPIPRVTPVTLHLHDVPACDALDEILEFGGSRSDEQKWRVDTTGGVVAFGAFETDTVGRVLRIYDVTDLMLASASVSSHFSVEPATANESTPAPGTEAEAAEKLIKHFDNFTFDTHERYGTHIEYWGGRLFVETTPQTHAKIARRFADMRSSLTH